MNPNSPFPFLTHINPAAIADELSTYLYLHPIDEAGLRYECIADATTGGIPGIVVLSNAYRVVDGREQPEGGTTYVGGVYLYPQDDPRGRPAWAVVPLADTALTQRSCFQPILEWLAQILPPREIRMSEAIVPPRPVDAPIGGMSSQTKSKSGAPRLRDRDDWPTRCQIVKKYLDLRRDGHKIADACKQSGIYPGQMKRWVAAYQQDCEIGPGGDAINTNMYQ